MVSHSGLITVMTRAARKAAPRLRRDFGEVEQLQVSRKGPADFVSMADKRAEQAIVDELRTRPARLGPAARRRRRDRRQSRQAALDRRSARRHQQLPPRHPAFRDLDRGAGEARPTAASELSHGLVYQPLTDETFWAEKGRGAWLQDRRLRVSSRRDLSDTLIGTGIPFLGRGDPGEWAKIYDAVAPEVAGIRRFGSAALDLAWVAAGRMDGFWEEDLALWDTAAGVLLVKEAGGFVTDYRGADRSFERGEYVAAAGQHPQQASETRRRSGSLGQQPRAEDQHPQAPSCGRPGDERRQAQQSPSLRQRPHARRPTQRRNAAVDTAINASGGRPKASAARASSKAGAARRWPVNEHAQRDQSVGDADNQARCRCDGKRIGCRLCRVLPAHASPTAMRMIVTAGPARPTMPSFQPSTATRSSYSTRSKCSAVCGNIEEFGGKQMADFVKQYRQPGERHRPQEQPEQAGRVDGSPDLCHLPSAPFGRIYRA